MKKYQKVIVGVVMSVSVLSLQGCIAAAIGSGIGAYKWGSSKESEAETQCKKEYPNYALQMEKVNKARKSRGEKAQPVMTLNEYCHLEEADDSKKSTENKTS